MFKVTPIGSCRITTPLRHGQAAHGLHLNLTRCYGYCHSPAEAVQLARFMRGELEIPADIWPLVSRSHDQAGLLAQVPEMSDLYVVEIASAKELTIDGVSIQLNYLRSAFPDFFADPDRARRFWALADAADAAAMSRFLKAAWSETEQQRADTAILTRIRRSLVTADSLRADLSTLQTLLPDMLVVTHVDAVKPDGQRIRSRSALISMLRAEARALGLPCCDPTELMGEFGQPRAIEDDSTSLAHFTAPFGEALMEEWMRSIIRPRTDAMAAEIPGALCAQLEAEAAAGRHAETALRLSSLDRPTPLTEALREDAALTLERARARFLARADDDPIQRMQAALDLGLFGVAAALAERIPGGPEALPCPLLTRLALAAEAAGDAAHAALFAVAACRSRTEATRAIDLLSRLVIRHGVSLTDVLTPGQLSRIRARLTPAQLARALQRDGAPLATLLSADMPAEELARIAGEAGPEAAPAIAYWRQGQRGTRLRDAALVALLDRWVAEARKRDAPLCRARALARLEQADPRHAGLRAALRDARIDLIARIRAAGNAGDMAALQALAPEVQALPGAGPEHDLWSARLHFAAGDYPRAIETGLAAAEAMEGKINIWVLVMRAAMRAGQKALADRASARVLALSAGIPRLEAEALKIRSALCAEV